MYSVNFLTIINLYKIFNQNSFKRNIDEIYVLLVYGFFLINLFKIFRLKVEILISLRNILFLIS